jgi:mannose-6-phosphate isomerase
VIKPVLLGPNQPRQFYQGGSAVAELRGTEVGDGFRPEDWVASATPRFGMSEDGLSRLPDGQYLRDALESDPERWLGPDHVAYFGSSPGLLVKLLDAGQRLPVHVHPDRSFAYRHLGSRHGKTEAWVVLGTEGADPELFLGWSRDVEAGELSRWVADQECGTMLANMHKLDVRPGDAVLVPAGTAHAIGQGVFVLELQEPTDFSIMLELEGFDLDPGGGELGLGRDLALSCVRQKAFSSADLDNLRRHGQTGKAAAGDSGGVEQVLPDLANPYFRAERAHVPDERHEVVLGPSFAVVLVVSGRGTLTGEGWEVAVKRGDTLVVPWGAGATKAVGQLELLRCLPPLPADARKDDPTAG